MQPNNVGWNEKVNEGRLIFHVAVDSKFLPTLWAKPPELLFPYGNNGTESYHSHLNAEFYVKHSNIYVFVDVLKKFNRQRMFPWTACHNRHGSPNTSERKQRLWCLPTTIIAHSVSQERNFWRKYVIVMDREPNCDSALRVDFILMWLLPCMLIHFCRAVSYITQMRFHNQLMRFHKTATWSHHKKNSTLTVQLLMS